MFLSINILPQDIKYSRKKLNDNFLISHLAYIFLYLQKKNLSTPLLGIILMSGSSIDKGFTEEFIQKIDDFLSGANKLAILGIGNEDNGDDAVGLYVLIILQHANLPDWVTNFYCERVPEHFLGKIAKLGPNRILLLDAADMKEIPGAIAIFSKELISKGFHMSTHNLSLTMLEEFLKPDVPDLVTLYIGIQPKNMLFQTPLSDECSKAADEFANLLIERIDLADKARNNN